MSNLVKRILAGMIGIPLILAASYFGGVYFLIFSVIVSSLALWEFCSMFGKKDLSPLKYFGLIVSAAIIILLYFDWEYLILIIFMTTSVITGLEIFRKQKNPLNPVILIFGIIYITFPFVLLNALIKLSDYNIVIYIFILIWTCDTAAYFGGRVFGRHQLSVISPKKTWEGSAAGFIFTVIISLLVHFIFPDKINLQDAVVAGSITGIFSQIGDLFESLLKRYCDVKDSSEIIPGHGGILDRFDSLIFVTPFIFVYFMYIK
ncbi:MAG: phosphatidate cytidylyltransferase [Ignavibacteria bacterium]|nr:phosphatidate cytidylyltransferase [Ignavibacteria bacterium]